MKKVIVACTITICLIGLFSCRCGRVNARTRDPYYRFEFINYEDLIAYPEKPYQDTSYGNAKYLIDKETGIVYLCINSGARGFAITPLLDKNGKPTTQDGFIKKP